MGKKYKQTKERRETFKANCSIMLKGKGASQNKKWKRKIKNKKNKLL